MMQSAISRDIRWGTISPTAIATIFDFIPTVRPFLTPLKGAIANPTDLARQIRLRRLLLFILAVGHHTCLIFTPYRSLTKSSKHNESQRPPQVAITIGNNQQRGCPGPALRPIIPPLPMLSNAKLSLKRLVKLRNLVLVSLAALMLSGCVNYDVGVHFDNQHSGQITQTVKLGDRLAAINGLSAQQWLDSLDQRARKLQGNTQRLSHSELQVTIPFTTDKDFVKKFNRFFEGQPAASELIETPNVSAQIALQQANWLLILRNHITLDVDLSSLGISSEEEGMMVNPGNLLDLDFHVDAPWGAKYKLRGANAIPGESLPGGMVWHMLPGQLNHIEGYFWMPSPLGLSSLGLIGLVVGATYLKKWKDQKAAAGTSTSSLAGKNPSTNEPTSETSNVGSEIDSPEGAVNSADSASEVQA